MTPILSIHHHHSSPSSFLSPSATNLTTFHPRHPSLSFSLSFSLSSFIWLLRHSPTRSCYRKGKHCQPPSPDASIIIATPSIAFCCIPSPIIGFWMWGFIYLFISSLISTVIIFNIGFGFWVLNMCFGPPFGWIIDLNWSFWDVICRYQFGLVFGLGLVVELIWISGLALLVHVFVTWLLVYKLKVGFVGIAITFGFSWDGCFISGIKGI